MREVELAIRELERQPSVRACTFESFPFDVLLPRIEAGRVVLPPPEPGVRPYSAWDPADGVEVPVYAGGLLAGRFVLHPNAPTCGVGLSAEVRERALALADGVGRAFTGDAGATTRTERTREAR